MIYAKIILDQSIYIEPIANPTNISIPKAKLLLNLLRQSSGEFKSTLSICWDNMKKPISTTIKNIIFRFAFSPAIAKVKTKNLFCSV